MKKGNQQQKLNLRRKRTRAQTLNTHNKHSRLIGFVFWEHKVVTKEQNMEMEAALDNYCRYMKKVVHMPVSEMGKYYFRAGWLHGEGIATPDTEMPSVEVIAEEQEIDEAKEKGREAMRLEPTGGVDVDEIVRKALGG